MGRLNHEQAHRGWRQCVEPKPMLDPQSIPPRMVREYLSDLLQAANATSWPKHTECSCNGNVVKTEYWSTSNARDRIVASIEDNETLTRTIISIEAGKHTLVVMTSVLTDDNGEVTYEISVTTNFFSMILLDDTKPPKWDDTAFAAVTPNDYIKRASAILRLVYPC
jgi:hypothetical protein